ncbi:polymorphic toxin-type HINT domain-containing protein [Nostoc sp.]|uniref:polymorphic toxin-type HINT domain-containing protein n=1 Tax=Nostoc sp. TaxID=1180 RepID=UPI002FFBAA15
MQLNTFKTCIKTCNCFVAGTKILTTEGEKNIEDIQVGDWVVSDDPNTPGEIEAHQVLQTFVHDVSSVVDIYINGEKISTTDDHPFWVKDKGWVKAKDLKSGDQLQNDKEEVVTVNHINRQEGNFKVYNFEVQDFHTYFVSDLGVLVHNTCNIDVINETINSKGQITSKYTIDANDALDTGISFLGPGYTEIGRPGSGVFRSKDGLRQFRIDSNSIQGLHNPNVPHVHFETFSPTNTRISITNNHVPIINY